MGLQIDVMQNAANGCRAEGRDYLVFHRLVGQILAGPVRAMQSLGNRFQTGEFNDLCPLHGGNLLRTARRALPTVGEQARQAIPAIPFTYTPNRGFITFQPGGDRTLTFPGSDSQNDLGSLYLKPRQGTAVSGGMQSLLIPPSNGQFLWSASTHEATSHAAKGLTSSIAGTSNSLQVLRAETLVPQPSRGLA